MSDRQEQYIKAYEALLKQGVAEAEARDRASLIQHPPILKSSVNPELPAGGVLEASVEERKDSIAASKKDYEKTKKKIEAIKAARAK